MVDIHLNWVNWFHFLIREERRLVILIDCTNSRSIECYPLTHGRSGSMFRVNRHVLNLGSF